LRRNGMFLAPRVVGYSVAPVKVSAKIVQFI